MRNIALYPLAIPVSCRQQLSKPQMNQLGVKPSVPSARSITFKANDRSLSIETCIMYGFPAPCALTSSSTSVPHDERHMGMLFSAAALDTPFSPSRWASLRAAQGENPNGKDTYRGQL